MKYEEIITPKQLLEYMDENVNYGFVGKNGKIYNEPGTDDWNNDWYKECVVQDDKSLIKTHYGTCWDQVELERKWFEEHNYQFKTIFMWFEINRDNSLPTHTFLIFKKNSKFYWFEHAFESQKGIHEFSNEDALIEYIKDEQLDYAMHEGNATYNDRYLIKCYEYSKPKPNLDVDEYIYHVTHSFEKNQKRN